MIIRYIHQPAMFISFEDNMMIERISLNLSINALSEQSSVLKGTRFAIPFSSTISFQEISSFLTDFYFSKCYRCLCTSQ